MGKSMKPGGGGRFAKLKGKLAGRKGVTNPGGLAATIGSKKYGKKKMAKWSAKGRKRASKTEHMVGAAMKKDMMKKGMM